MWLTWSLLQGPIIASVDIELRIASGLTFVHFYGETSISVGRYHM